MTDLRIREHIADMKAAIKGAEEWHGQKDWRGMGDCLARIEAHRGILVREVAIREGAAS